MRWVYSDNERGKKNAQTTHYFISIRLVVVPVPVQAPATLVPLRALSRIRRVSVGLPSLQRSKSATTPQKSQHPSSKQIKMTEIGVHLPLKST